MSVLIDKSVGPQESGQRTAKSALLEPTWPLMAFDRDFYCNMKQNSGDKDVFYTKPALKIITKSLNSSKLSGKVEI